MQCLPAFVAAPIFNSKREGSVGLADEIWGWAVTKGQHVDVNYRSEGQLCGYLTGYSDFDFYLGEYRRGGGRGSWSAHAIICSGRVKEAPPFPYP